MSLNLVKFFTAYRCSDSMLLQSKKEKNCEGIL